MRLAGFHGRAGGWRNRPTGVTQQSADLFDPVSGRYSPAQSMGTRRAGLVLAAVGSRIIAAGGSNASSSGLTTAELYNPTNHTWSPTGSMVYGGATTIAWSLFGPSEEVLVSGGNTSEIYSFSGTWLPAGPTTMPRVTTNNSPSHTLRSPRRRAILQKSLPRANGSSVRSPRNARPDSAWMAIVAIPPVRTCNACPPRSASGPNGTCGAIAAGAIHRMNALQRAQILSIDGACNAPERADCGPPEPNASRAAAPTQPP
jgi:hypothetical protein